MRLAVQYAPFPVAGLTGDSEDTDASNSYISPLTSIRDNDRRQDRIQLNMGGAFTWEFYKNLKFKTEIGYDLYRNDSKVYMGISTYYIQNFTNLGLPTIRLEKQNRHKIRNTNTLSYDFKDIFGKDSKHHLNALVGQEYVIQKNELLTNIAEGFPTSFTAEECWNLTAMVALSLLKAIVGASSPLSLSHGVSLLSLS